MVAGCRDLKSQSETNLLLRSENDCPCKLCKECGFMVIEVVSVLIEVVAVCSDDADGLIDWDGCSWLSKKN